DRRRRWGERAPGHADWNGHRQPGLVAGWRRDRLPIPGRTRLLDATADPQDSSGWNPPGATDQLRAGSEPHDQELSPALVARRREGLLHARRPADDARHR